MAHRPGLTRARARADLVAGARVVADPRSVTGTAQYFRHALVRDLGSARAAYATPANLAAILPDPLDAAREGAPDIWWSIVSIVLWARVLSAEQKTTLRAEFVAWRLARDAEPSEPDSDAEPSASNSDAEPSEPDSGAEAGPGRKLGG
jgi:hypothetical protein